MNKHSKGKIKNKLSLFLKQDINRSNMKQLNSINPKGDISGIIKKSNRTEVVNKYNSVKLSLLMYKKIVNGLKISTGDIILFEGITGLSSKLIKFATNSTISHVGIIQKIDSFDEDPMGIYIHTSDTDEPQIDFLKSKPKNGVMLIGLKEKLEKYEGRIYLRKLNKPFSKHYEKLMFEIYSTNIETPFETRFFELLAPIFQLLLYNNTPTIDKVTCSEWTAEILQQLKLLPNNLNNGLSSKFYSPKHFIWMKLQNNTEGYQYEDDTVYLIKPWGDSYDITHSNVKKYKQIKIFGKMNDLPTSSKLKIYPILLNMSEIDRDISKMSKIIKTGFFSDTKVIGGMVNNIDKVGLKGKLKLIKLLKKGSSEFIDEMNNSFTLGFSGLLFQCSKKWKLCSPYRIKWISLLYVYYVGKNANTEFLNWSKTNSSKECSKETDYDEDDNFTVFLKTYMKKSSSYVYKSCVEYVLFVYYMCCLRANFTYIRPIDWMTYRDPTTQFELIIMTGFYVITSGIKLIESKKIELYTSQSIYSKNGAYQWPKNYLELIKTYSKVCQ